ncbi:MAG: polyphosphate polymerase domain-containing protein [Eubacteriales bacterium]
MTEPKFRHELKHNINYYDYLELTRKLKYFTKIDKNADDSGTYRIRSLYFDNFNDKALREKINGFSNREKFRIRYYNDDLSYIRLEKKSKHNGLCLKQKAIITKKECEELIAGNLEFLKDPGKPLFLELYTKMQYHQLRPKNIVDYTREAYVYPIGNVRITIDSKIRGNEFVGEFLNPDSMGIPLSNPIILEIKYDEFLPQIISDITQIRNRHAAAFSKYAAARIG